MEILSQIFYFIIIISILVVVHELGHFLAAKLFRMRVEQFSIGFPPRAFGRKIGETDYCVSYVPFGGYVKIAGMIDESLDTAHLSEQVQPWEFRAKPVWQRVIVIVAGVAMNILLAIAIFSGMSMTRGFVYHVERTVGFIQAKTPAEDAGFLSGDKVLTVNGEPIQYWEDIDRLAAFNAGSGSIWFDVERDGARMRLQVPRKDLHALTSGRLGIFANGSRPTITGVEPGMPAANAGLEINDAFVEINGTRVQTSEDVITILHKNINTPMSAVWLRNGREMRGTLTPNDDGKIGIVIVNDFPSRTVTIRYGFFESIAVGTRMTVSFTVMTVQNIWHIIVGKASFRESVGGPVKIAKMAAQQAEVGIASFLGLVALLSISLAIINILPFPVLDGGHLVFLVYEAVFKREVPNRLRIVLQQAGMVLLIIFMVFVIYNDIFH